MNPQTACDETGFSFTKAELTRLTAYRAAVRVGFYTDEYPEIAQGAAEALNLVGAFAQLLGQQHSDQAPARCGC